MRLRPGLSVGHVVHPAPLGPTTARFTWAAPDGTHVMHFGHEREVRAVLGLPGAVPVVTPPDYAPLFPQGMGVGRAARCVTCASAGRTARLPRRSGAVPHTGR